MTALAGAIAVGVLSIEGRNTNAIRNRSQLIFHYSKSIESPAGPIVGGFVNRFGVRMVTLLGTVISGASVVASAYAPTLGIFILLYSFIGGAATELGLDDLTHTN